MWSIGPEYSLTHPKPLDHGPIKLCQGVSMCGQWVRSPAWTHPKPWDHGPQSSPIPLGLGFGWFFSHSLINPPPRNIIMHEKIFELYQKNWKCDISNHQPNLILFLFVDMIIFIKYLSLGLGLCFELNFQPNSKVHARL